jgi:hypothetical protein
LERLQKYFTVAVLRPFFCAPAKKNDASLAGMLTEDDEEEVGHTTSESSDGEAEEEEDEEEEEEEEEEPTEKEVEEEKEEEVDNVHSEAEQKAKDNAESQPPIAPAADLEDRETTTEQSTTDDVCPCANVVEQQSTTHAVE